MNKKVMTSLLFACSLSFANVINAPATDVQIKTGVELVLKQYDWSQFWEEFTISPSEWTKCNTSDPKKGMFGMAATMIEPLYIVDVTTSSSKVHTLGLSIGDTRPDLEGEATHNGGVYVNVFRFPLMDMILGKTTQGLFAFDKGYATLIYLGYFDPKKWNDILAFSLIPERGLFSTVAGALAGVASCVASSGFDKLPHSTKRGDGIGKSFRNVIDSLYFSVGCKGIVPVGTITTNVDPISNAILAMSSVLSDMHSNKGMVATVDVKHRVRSVLNGHSKSILCQGYKNPIVPFSMYTQQILYPTVNKPQEIGISPIENAFGSAGLADNTVIMVFSQRKDYAAFAYQD